MQKLVLCEMGVWVMSMCFELRLDVDFEVVPLCGGSFRLFKCESSKVTQLHF